MKDKQKNNTITKEDIDLTENHLEKNKIIFCIANNIIRKLDFSLEAIVEEKLIKKLIDSNVVEKIKNIESIEDPKNKDIKDIKLYRKKIEKAINNWGKKTSLKEMEEFSNKLKDEIEQKIAELI